jgi:hypothetical protein
MRSPAELFPSGFPSELVSAAFVCSNEAAWRPAFASQAVDPQDFRTRHHQAATEEDHLHLAPVKGPADCVIRSAPPCAGMPAQ